MVKAPRQQGTEGAHQLLILVVKVGGKLAPLFTTLNLRRRSDD